MKNTKKILSILLSICLLFSALGTGFAVSADTALPVLEGHNLPPTDYSVLTPGTYKDTVTWEGKLDTTMEIFTDGILIDTGNFGVNSASLSNFHGFQAYDTDSDGKTDFIETQSYNNAGARFTLGLNAGANHAGAKALAIKVDNINIAESWINAVQSWVPTLVCDDGTTYNLKAHNTVGDDVVTYFINTADNSITTREYNDYATGIIQGRVAGWMVFPFNVFEGEVDATKVNQVALSLSTYWNVNNRIYEIGFVTDIDGFLGKAPAEPVTPFDADAHITMATDYSGLAPSETAYVDAFDGNGVCLLDPECDLIANGYMTDDTSVIGVGAAPMTNFHGFYARDIDGDGGSDYLEAFPYNAGGMRFTLGMTEEPEVSGEAIAIHVESNFPSSGFEVWPHYYTLTLNTSEGAVAMRAASSTPADVNYYFINSADSTITTYNYQTEGGMHTVGRYPNGWLIVPLNMFAGEVDTADITSIHFALSSYWGTYVRIYGVGYVEDMYTMLGLERPIPTVAESELLDNAMDYSGLTISSGDNRNNYIDAVNGWNCVPDTTTSIFTEGVWVNTNNFGYGAGTTNFHGFYANDLDADGLADSIEAYPWDNGGMNFTLGLNGNVAANGDGIAIHFSYIDNGSGFYDGLWINTKLTLNTANESYALNRDDRAAYFVENATYNVTVRNLKENSGLIAAKHDGWLVLPIEAFGNIDTADIESIKFELASTWYYNLRISEISVVSNINELVSATLGDIDWDGEVNANDLVNARKIILGSSSGNIDANMADVNDNGEVDVRDLVRLKKDLAA